LVEKVSWQTAQWALVRRCQDLWHLLQVEVDIMYGMGFC
jgi:hypothetical protein